MKVLTEKTRHLLTWLKEILYTEQKSERFVFYLQNGIKTNRLPNGYTGFYIRENLFSSGMANRYFFQGDGILYELDNKCVDLYDAFQDAIFVKKDDYYKNIDIQPQWISRAGLDSDFNMDKDTLAECFSTPIQKQFAEYGVTDSNLLAVYEEIELKKFKYAYTADCQSLINTLQELLFGSCSSFVGFYSHLCSLDCESDMEDYYECSTASRMVFSFLNSFIIQIYSIFDILTKIAYEFENIQECDLSYAKLASSKVLYGDKKKLKIEANGTIFEKCRVTSIFENLRNELVHNATWEMDPKIFTKVENGVIIDRCIYLPDFTKEGTIVTYKNRKRFFADGKRVNEELPSLYFEVLRRVDVTLMKLLKDRYIY